MKGYPLKNYSFTIQLFISASRLLLLSLSSFLLARVSQNLCFRSRIRQTSFSSSSSAFLFHFRATGAAADAAACHRAHFVPVRSRRLDQPSFTAISHGNQRRRARNDDSRGHPSAGSARAVKVYFQCRTANASSRARGLLI